MTTQREETKPAPQEKAPKKIESMGLSLLVPAMLVLGFFAGWIGSGLISSEMFTWTFWADDQIKQASESFRNFGLVFVGFFTAIFGLGIAIWRNYNLHRSAEATQQQAEIAEKSHKSTVEAARKDHFVKRFKEANELFAKPETRVGAIYEFGELMKLADEHDHYWPCVQVLMVYLRQQLLWTEEKEQENNEWWESYWTWHTDLQTKGGADGPEPNYPFHPAHECQSILTILGERPTEFIQTESKPLNFRSLDLRGADLRNCDFKTTLFDLAHMERASLYNADLQKAGFWKADLRGANLSEARLEGTSLWGANLDGASLRDALAGKASFWQSSLIGADLSGTNFEKSDLREVRFSGTDLRNTNVKKANLEGAEYSGRTRFPDDFDPKNYGMRSDKDRPF